MRRRILLSSAVALASMSILSPKAKAGAGGLVLNGVQGLAQNNSTIYNSTFQGTVTITKLAYDGQLKVFGRITGTVSGANGGKDVTNQQFEQYATLVNSGGSSARRAPAACSILDLDIGAIHLNLLGLVIDLAPIHLDITAIPGGLLGDLLCSLAGLLDNLVFGNGLGNVLRSILNIINQINDILAGL
jgi:hypothetical protein